MSKMGDFLLTLEECMHNTNTLEEAIERSKRMLPVDVHEYAEETLRMMYK